MPLLPNPVLRICYEKSADEYERNLTLEDIMEATPQATQREITLESLALVRAQRPDFHLFNELLIQYPLNEEGDEIGHVVPDNMVVIHDGVLKVDKSYDIPLQPARPFMVMEYVSKKTERKDYEISFRKFEQNLKIPYFLLFYPDNQELTLFKLGKNGYVSVKPDNEGFCAIAKLDLKVRIEEGWLRYWYKEELLPLPADLLERVEDLQKEVKEAKRRIKRESRRADEATKRAEQEAQRAERERMLRLASDEELTRLRAELEKLKRG